MTSSLLTYGNLEWDHGTKYHRRSAPWGHMSTLTLVDHNDVGFLLFQVIRAREEAEAEMAVRIAEVESEYRLRQEVGHDKAHGI